MMLRARNDKRNGLTLLELLVVLFILSMVAISAVSLTAGLDEQARFEDTRTRVDNIRSGIIGHPGKFLNGQPVVNGFVADVGRLPNSLQELMDRGTLPAWQPDARTGTWAGWRGPYVPIQPDTAKAYRDGWGNSGSAPNYGWKTFAVDQVGGNLSVESFGSDGVAGGTGYAADFPATGPIVERNDHQVLLSGWSVKVQFVNPTGGPALPVAAEVLRLRVFYPMEGSFNWTTAWPATSAERDAAPYFSLALTLAPGEVADGSTLERTFTFGGAANFIPWGVHSVQVVRDADGQPFGPAGQLHVITMVPRTQLVSPTLTCKME